MRTRYGYPRVVVATVVSLLLLAVNGYAAAAAKPVPPNANAQGGYAALSADWLEWLIAIPAPDNPLFDPTGADAAQGQAGNVWFLTGTTGGAATRTVTVPAGTFLFFPIINFFWVNTPEYGDPEWSPEQEESVRAFLASHVDTAHDVQLQVDGRSVSNVPALRISGAVGSCTIPDDNIFGAPFASGPHACVADGYWALLQPLAKGSHTIHFSGGLAADGFTLDVTYHVTVSGR